MRREKNVVSKSMKRELDLNGAQSNLHGIAFQDRA